MPVSGVSLGGADSGGESDGLPPGSADGDGLGPRISPGAVGGTLFGDVVAAGEEHAAKTTRTTRRTGTRAKRSIGLVGVEADVGSLDRRKRAIPEQAGLLAQELELGPQPGGRVRKLQQVLLA